MELANEVEEEVAIEVEDEVANKENLLVQVDKENKKDIKVANL